MVGKRIIHVVKSFMQRPMILLHGRHAAINALRVDAYLLAGAIFDL